ncbi:putative bifunctional diguanylate cyclase/phosphodiesterase [Cellulomonas aerilata]|uniref:GGDEF-domain containing protein n=1 Tax=Cellulomonas aerilata TaxID=515326 RepID=A0A512D9H2_9CELL|nr:bifunctional diguanylate cyclase/phosphodiesterase [Cellulomonas aerilata]GEO33091.1 hypothetical protein CAE01nite_08160 [Cellulomonas aerilata]
MRAPGAALEVALQAHPDDGFLLLRTARGAGGRPQDVEITWANPTALRLLGARVAPPCRASDAMPPDVVSQWVARYEKAVTGPGRSWTNGVHGSSGHDATGSLYSAAFFPADDGVVVHLRAASHVMSALARDALHDPLTDLPNRRLLDEYLGMALTRIARHRHPVGVLFCDVDNLKWVNDRLGHAAGDRLLRHVARRIRAAVRDEDFVARFGGDEFVVVVQDLPDLEAVSALAERVLAAVRGDLTLDAVSLHAGVSIGVAVATEAMTAAQVLSRADSALYRAKRQGRGRTRAFDTALSREVDRRLTLEADLRQAIERQELELAYQPLFDLSSDTLAGVEALIRWRHPSGTVRLPGSFLDVAEETGLIVPICEWVLATACTAARGWVPAAGPRFKLHLNHAACHLGDGQMTAHVQAALDSSGLDPGRVVVEVTESQVLTDFDEAHTALSALRALGVGVALDDFGTGYSSLTRLQRLPVDVVKLDGSFIEHLEHRDRDRDVVRSVIDLSHSLHAAVVGEGIETDDQQRVLRDLGCDLGQGFHLARPVGAAQVSAML